MVIERLGADCGKKRILDKTASLEAKIDRLAHVYVNGHIAQDVYRSRRNEALQRPEGLVVPEVDTTLMAADVLKDMRKVWGIAEVPQRRRLVGAMVEAAYEP